MIDDEWHEEVRATHGDGWWFGCEFPERPSGEFTMWVWRCDACILHLAVAATLDGDGPSDIIDGDDKRYATLSTLAEALEAALAWRAEMDLPLLRTS